jgi:hypothetical protein
VAAYLGRLRLAAREDPLYQIVAGGAARAAVADTTRVGIVDAPGKYR